MTARACLAITLGLLLAAACSDSSPASEPKAECTPIRFRACETDACAGVQQCVDPGHWTKCSCTVLDASYADAGEGGSDADATASDADAAVSDADAAAGDADAAAGDADGA